MGVEELDREVVLVEDAGPVVDACASEGIDRELEGGVLEGVEVDDVGEIVDVGGEEVMAVSGLGGESFGIGGALYAGEVIGDEVVGAVLDPFCGGGVGRAAVGGVYLKPPSSGGLWLGVMTMPSARSAMRFSL